MISAPAPSPMVGGTSGLVGAIGNSSNHIQLAPLRVVVAAGGGTNAVAGMSDSIELWIRSWAAHSSNAVPSALSSSSVGAAYPVMRLQGISRSAYDAARDDRGGHRERDHKRLELRREDWKEEPS
jgi:hypothetical protein